LTTWSGFLLLPANRQQRARGFEAKFSKSVDPTGPEPSALRKNKSSVRREQSFYHF
jgi:hypothetical protein